MNKCKMIKYVKPDIEKFCRKYHIKKLSLFGSILRGDSGPHSDIDILVEFHPEKVPGFFELADMERELSSYFSGRKVDLRTPNDLSRYFRHEVLEAAEDLDIVWKTVDADIAPLCEELKRIVASEGRE